MLKVDIQFKSVLFGFCDMVDQSFRSSPEFQSTYHWGHEERYFKVHIKKPHQRWINEVTTWKWQPDEDCIVVII